MGWFKEGEEVERESADHEGMGKEGESGNAGEERRERVKGKVKMGDIGEMREKS